MNNLQADCVNCFGLCCVALYFSASEGFPIDKDAGQPCQNLQQDYRCCVHKNLKEQGLKGCLSFDCFGAGQKVSRVSFGGNDWRKVPESAGPMFKVFLIMRQLHELLWYLTEAQTLQPARSIHNVLSSMLEETEQLTYLSPDSLIDLNVAEHRSKVNTLLLKTSELVRAEAYRGQKSHLGSRKAFGRGTDLVGADLRKLNLRGANLRGALLIAADLRGNDLSGTDFIGADFRDADLRGADLSKSIFLTQAQLNVAKGDTSTKFPSTLNRPAHWALL
ncbi:pentapeptide repeat-containing protein [Desulfosporosinus sp.]|uniref:pentapeptide repeat-containing protein n=1 Tax=Desulfosporosinus sp. TaxID=157907 RepID=UPI0025BD4819|nr:pentapeptide repeat-containing protein [Desulfosporosinus sp.]